MKNNPWEDTLYILGERLQMPVYQIKAEMPLSEFLGWLRHFQNKHKPDPVDLTEMQPEQLAEMFNK